jgi:hypothetical protein
MESCLKLGPCSAQDLQKPLAEMLQGTKVMRLEGRRCRPYWVVAGRLEKRVLMDHGVPFGQVWTLAELASVGVQPTLDGVRRAFGLFAKEPD